MKHLIRQAKHSTIFLNTKNVQKSIAFCFFLCCGIIAATAQEKQSLAHIGFVYPVSTHGTMAGDYSNKLSFHVIAGLSKNETGLALSGVANIIKHNASGVQIAGVFNQIKNSSRGVQLAGAFNQSKGGSSSCQIAGVTNISGTESDVFPEMYDGIQVSGAMNVAKNVGLQIGTVNLASNVKYLQFGVVNIAKDNPCPIGLLNLVKNGEKSIGVSVDETMTTLVSFRSGGKVTYGILGIGYNLKNASNHFYAAEMGIGAHLNISERFRINNEITGLYLDNFKKGDYFKASVRILPALKLTRQIELFAGPTFNYMNTTYEEGTKLISHYTWSKTSGDNFKGLYFGGVAGIQFIL